MKQTPAQVRAGQGSAHFKKLFNERYIVGLGGRKVLWAGERPLRLDLSSDSREQVILRRVSDGIQFSVAGRSRVIRLEQLEYSSEVSIELSVELPRELLGGASKLVLSICRAQPLRPAYFTDAPKEPSAEPSSVPAASSELRVFCGYNGQLSGFNALTRNMVVRAESTRVFIVKKTRIGYRIKSVTDGLCLSVGTEVLAPLKNKEVRLLSAKDLESVTIFWGANWWRMRRVAICPLEKVAVNLQPSAEQAESLWFKKFNQKLAMGCAAIVLLVLLLPHENMSLDTESKTDEPPPTTTIALKKPKIIERMSAPKTVAQAPAPVKQPVPKKTVAVKKKTEPKKVDIAAAQARAQAKAKAQEQAKARSNLAKSLGFLSNAPTQKSAPDSAVVSQRADARYRAMTQALPRDANSGEALNQLAKTSPAHGPIQTEGARTMDSKVTVSGGSKTLNEVQGRVSLSALSTSGGTGGVLSSKGITMSGSGALAESEIERALSKHLAKFQYCYEKALLTDASLAGNILVQWTIGGQGTVSDAKIVRSQIANAPLQQCLLSEIGHVHFPAPQGGAVVVQYPFAFSSTPL